jgi:hypothetical protein
MAEQDDEKVEALYNAMREIILQDGKYNSKEAITALASLLYEVVRGAAPDEKAADHVFYILHRDFLLRNAEETEWGDSVK